MRSRLGIAAFWLWVPAMVLPGVYLMAGHLLTLPRPDQLDPDVARAIEAARAPEERGAWMAVHVLSAECGCSQRVLEHLVARGPVSGMREKVLFIGEPTALTRRARAAGFTVDLLTGDELAARYRLEAAPLLVVADPRDEVRYLGGYAERAGSPVIEDTSVFARLRAGESVAPLPIFGCAVSRRLQKTLDPLGLKQ